MTKYTNTNTQIHKYSLVKFADRPNKCYIFEKEMVPGPQEQCSQVFDMQIHNTNTQIQFELNLQIPLTCAILLKR